jgi:DNA anti-recombination protein RmuC
VRFITSADDPYTWKVLPEKEHLFKKQLSKHSTREYMELWREVGVSFEAVLASKSNECLQRESQQPGQESVESKVSFTARIEELEADKAKLTNELNQWKHQAECAKEEVNRLRITMQAAKQQDAQKMALMVEYYRKITIKSFHEVNGVFERFGFTSF